MMAVKHKKKNKFLPMIVMAVILAVLIVGTTLLSAANEKKAAEEAAKLAQENAAVMLAEYDVSTTQEIAYSRRNEDFLTFTVQNGQWVYADDPKFPLNQERVSKMASALSSIAAVRALEEVDMEAYGLNDPAYVIRVSYSTGDSHVYTIGDVNTFSGDYYFTMDGACYMIAAGLIPYFSYGLNDLLMLDTYPAAEWQDIAYVTSVTVTKDGAAKTVTDEAGMTEIIAQMDLLDLKTCADYYADADEKAVYGLDGADSVTVKYKKAVTSTDTSGNQTVNYLETSYTLTFGGEAADGAVYGIPSKSDIVYAFDGDAVNGLLAFAE